MARSKVQGSVDMLLPGVPSLQETSFPSRLLYVGDLACGTTSRMRCDSLRQLGFDVAECATDAGRPGLFTKYAGKVANRLRFPLDHVGANQAILASVRDLGILWLDKANSIRPETLRCARRINPTVTIIGYSPDDMIQRHCSSRYFLAGLKHYDAFITTKSFGVEELKAIGCKRVIFSPNAYDPNTHRPPRNEMEKTISVGFIGYFEDARCKSIAYLCDEGVEVTASGPGWVENRRRLPRNAVCLPTVTGAEYTNRIHRTLINLGFLRKLNRDYQTQRSVEIPACGGFMMAERTKEHQSLFKEGEEAEFFDTDEELLRKTRWYLSHPEQCAKIAAAGLSRCQASGYSYGGRLKKALHEIGVTIPGSSFSGDQQ